MYYDRITEVSKGTILVYSRSNDEIKISHKLREWENAGYLTVLKPIHDCMDQEACIRLLGPVPLPK